MFFSMMMMMMIMLSLQFCRNFNKMEIVVGCWREWWRRRRRRRRTISLVKEGEDSWVPIFLLLPSKGKFAQYSTLLSWFHTILFHGIHILGWNNFNVYICLRVCWAKKMCHWRTYVVGNVPSPFIQMNVGNKHLIPSPCISHNKFLFNYTTHWCWLLPTILAFITPKGDVGFHHPWRRFKILHEKS